MALLHGLPDQYYALSSALDALGTEESVIHFDFIRLVSYRKNSASTYAHRQPCQSQRHRLSSPSTISIAKIAILVSHDHVEVSTKGLASPRKGVGNTSRT